MNRLNRWDVVIIRFHQVTGSRWRHQREIFFRYWPFVRGIHRSLVNSLHKRQLRGVWYFLYLCLNKRLGKKSWARWFETPLRSLWRHCNDLRETEHTKLCSKEIYFCAHLSTQSLWYPCKHCILSQNGDRTVPMLGASARFQSVLTYFGTFERMCSISWFLGIISTSHIFWSFWKQLK